MAAELRPISHLIKMKKARMLHLQRIVRPDLLPNQDLAKTDVQDLSRRLTDMEKYIAERAPQTKLEDGSVLKISSVVKQNIQPQLDSLNRAMRRYEKRQTALAIQTEGRFGDLEIRIKDALSLAASAARTGQKPGVITATLAWFSNLFRYFLQILWAVFVYPFYLASAFSATVKSLFVWPKRPRKRVGKGEEHASIASSRMYPKSAR
jgi:hypothetical protein